MTNKPNDALLQECRDLFRDRLLESVRTTLDSVAASLQAMADKTTDFEVRGRYLDARELAVKHREVIEGQFRRRLQSEFQSRVDKSNGEGSVAHIMYKHEGSTVSVFMLPRSHRAEEHLGLLGHHAAIWSTGDRTFVVIARKSREELERIAAFIHDRLR